MILKTEFLIRNIYSLVILERICYKFFGVSCILLNSEQICSSANFIKDFLVLLEHNVNI